MEVVNQSGRNLYVAIFAAYQQHWAGPRERICSGSVSRRFKRRGRSWTRQGAAHLVQLFGLQDHPNDWIDWCNKTALAKTKVTQVVLHPLRLPVKPIDQHYQACVI